VPQIFSPTPIPYLNLSEASQTNRLRTMLCDPRALLVRLAIPVSSFNHLCQAWGDGQ
jgi:hypothetical protein